MTNKDSGPAFPAKGTYRQLADSGMSLRDWFAGMAMQGLLSDSDIHGSADQFAEWAYEQADAMLAERNKED